VDHIGLRLRLADKPQEEGPVPGQCRTDGFQSHRAIQRGIEAGVHLPHPTGGQSAFYAEVFQHRTGGQRLRFQLVSQLHRGRDGGWNGGVHCGPSTMSPRMEPTAASSSCCSLAPMPWTLRAATKSSAIASNSAFWMCIPAWPDFIGRPVYLHGPPLASQICSERWLRRLSKSVKRNS